MNDKTETHVRQIVCLLASDGAEAIYVDGKLDGIYETIYASHIAHASDGLPVYIEQHSVSDDAWPEWSTNANWPEDLESLREHFED